MSMDNPRTHAEREAAQRADECPRCHQPWDASRDVRIVNTQQNGTAPYCSQCLQVAAQRADEAALPLGGDEYGTPDYVLDEWERRRERCGDPDDYAPADDPAGPGAAAEDTLLATLPNGQEIRGTVQPDGKVHVTDWPKPQTRDGRPFMANIMATLRAEFERPDEPLPGVRSHVVLTICQKGRHQECPGYALDLTCTCQCHTPHTHPCPTCRRDRSCTCTVFVPGEPLECATCSQCRGW